MHWKELAKDKKRRQLESIPKEWLISVPPDDTVDVTKYPEECGLLSANDIEITNTDLEDLLKKLASGEWMSVDVTTAFYKRAVIAQQLTNCLTEIFVDKALARAAEVDDHLKKTGQILGPLHGLPVSLKDQLMIKGLETIMGYVSWIGEYAENNSVLVDILLDAGAVPFVRTNVPQTLMWGETFNHAFGRTSNPYNRSLTCGGSSGGEGALIALRGSPLGVGSDVGGSIRIPSAFCGIYGLRTSYNRVPYSGATNSLDGQESILSVFGPLSTSLAALKVFMRAVLGAEPWLKDPLSIRKKWDEEEYQLAGRGGGKQMCFGILWNNGEVVPHPPVIRALEITKQALINAGHKVIDWTPLKHSEICLVMLKIWNAGMTEDVQAVVATSGEPIIRTMFPGNPANAFLRPLPDGITAYQLWQLHKTRRDLRKVYLDHWQGTVQETGTGRPVDAIIAPVAPYTAPPHGLNNEVNYTTIWNGLDCPAAVFPVTTVDPVVDAKKPPHKFLSEADKRIYELYDPALFMGTPIALQLVGRTSEDEAVIGMTEIVDAAIRELLAL